MNERRDTFGSRAFLLTGALTLLVLVFGLGSVGALTQISGAVVTQGTVDVVGNRQVVQHPTGGVVKSIFARDGDHVAADQVLVRLDGGRLSSELAIVEGQLFEMLARQNRLAAIRDGLPEIVFDFELIERARADPELGERPRPSVSNSGFLERRSSKRSSNLRYAGLKYPLRSGG